ncbi:conserved hypothetical protein (plasmid) [Arthrobacter sp. FB24]|nr:conserved hypothetical protein [Arthrobacter sp. FB24]
MPCRSQARRAGAGGAPSVRPVTYSFLLTRQWLGILGLAALFAAACVGLGNWQLDRRNQAVAEIQRVQQNYEKEPVPFESARRYFEVAEPEAKWTPVSVRGHYLASDQRIVRNRPNNAAPGYEVLVPFRLASGETIVINRGWLPIGNLRPGYPDAVPAPPEGIIDAVVRLKPAEPGLDRAAPEGQLASIELVAYTRQLAYPLMTGSYGLMASESPGPDETPLQLTPPSVQEGSNLSYALQWITFGVLAFVGFGYTAKQHARMRREELEQDAPVTANRPLHPSRTRRRAGSDDEEDAMLDALGL